MHLPIAIGAKGEVSKQVTERVQPKTAQVFSFPNETGSQGHLSLPERGSVCNRHAEPSQEKNEK